MTVLPLFSCRLRASTQFTNSRIPLRLDRPGLGGVLGVISVHCSNVNPFTVRSEAPPSGMGPPHLPCRVTRGCCPQLVLTYVGGIPKGGASSPMYSNLWYSSSRAVTQVSFCSHRLDGELPAPSVSPMQTSVLAPARWSLGDVSYRCILIYHIVLSQVATSVKRSGSQGYGHL
ncbi:hypothetical protein FA13DRAFT_338107 [Coprinellus micaceus]|uniref:Uncharacterized protein n=1 Tax=Coprinellus micaceus TaxID=71717 RepID=A0A4Y7TBV8_COPMI|nr:hypothetical protein FA13DRAFT_338107 [Coprinellus micaceus]